MVKFYRFIGKTRATGRASRAGLMVPAPAGQRIVWLTGSPGMTEFLAGLP